MTQNKKKGIAKKALSVSLVAAMLATSNVPAWASGFTAEEYGVASQGFAPADSDNMPMLQATSGKISLGTGIQDNTLDLAYVDTLTDVTINATATAVDTDKGTYKLVLENDTTTLQLATANITAQNSPVNLSYDFQSDSSNVVTGNYEVAVYYSDGSNDTKTEIVTVPLTITNSSDSDNWNIGNFATEYLNTDVEWDDVEALKTIDNAAKNIKTEAGGEPESAELGFISNGTVMGGILPEDSAFVEWDGTSANAKEYIDKTLAVRLVRENTSTGEDVEYYVTGVATVDEVDASKIAADKIELVVNGVTVNSESKAVPYAANYSVESVKLTLKDGMVLTVDPRKDDGVTASATAASNKAGETIALAVGFTSGSTHGVDGNLALNALNPTITGLSFEDLVSFKGGSITYDPRFESFEALAKEYITSGLEDGTDYDVHYYKNAKGEGEYTVADVPGAGDSVYLGVTGKGEYANYDRLISDTALTITKKDLGTLDVDESVLSSIEWSANLSDDIDEALETMVKYNATDDAYIDFSNTGNAATFDLEVVVSGGTREGEEVTITIRGKAPVENYSGEKIITFTPVSDTLPTDVQGAFEEAIKAAGWTYDAKYHSVNNLVTGSIDVLARDQYELSCDQVTGGSIKNAGTYTITLTATDAPYRGMTATAELEVAPRNVNVFANGKGVEANVIVYDPDRTTLTKDELGVVLTYNGEVLRDGVDADISIDSMANYDAGTSIEITINADTVDSAVKNYTGTLSNLEVGKIQKKSIAEVDMPAIPVQVYKDIDWATADLGDLVVVKEDGTVMGYDDLLQQETGLTAADYSVTIVGPEGGLGTATVIFKGLGTNYTGSVEKTFEIVSNSMNAEFRYYTTGTTTVNTLPELVYNYNGANSKDGIVYDESDFASNASKDKIVVVNTATGQPVSTDLYTISYRNNTAVGTATIEAKGVNGYDLYAAASFEIVPMQFDKDSLGLEIELDKNSYTYTGSSIEPEATIINNNHALRDGRYTLQEGVDYQVSYSNNVNAAKDNGANAPTVTITGLGNYTFIQDRDAQEAATNWTNTGISKKFTIEESLITSADIKVNDVAYAGGLEVVPDITLTNPTSNQPLVEGTDYTIEVENGVNTGAATATIKLTAAAAKNYDLIKSGGTETTVKFQIEKKSLSDCEVTVIGGTVTVKNGEVIVPESEYTVTDLGNGSYRVSAKADSKNYTGSVTVNEMAPGATVLSVAERTTSTVTMNWDKVDGAEGYTIWYRSEYDTEMSRKIIFDGEQTSWTLKGLQPGTKYFFAMRSWVKDAEGNYIFSDVSPTQRGTTKPLAATIIGVTVTDGKIKVRLAGEAEGAEMYSMCYGDSRACFKENDFKVGIRTQYTTRTLNKTFEPGTYYVCVKSYRDLGNNKRVYGEWSNTFRAVVK